MYYFVDMKRVHMHCKIYMVLSLAWLEGAFHLKAAV